MSYRREGEREERYRERGRGTYLEMVEQGTGKSFERKKRREQGERGE